MANALGRIRPSQKKGLVYTFEINGELSDAANGIGSLTEAASLIIAAAEAEPWGSRITNVNITITAPEPQPGDAVTP